MAQILFEELSVAERSGLWDALDFLAAPFARDEPLGRTELRLMECVAKIGLLPMAKEGTPWWIEYPHMLEKKEPAHGR